ncbi:MAG: M23 family metallopeptidase [Desulfitobacteriaceae bacterium]
MLALALKGGLLAALIALITVKPALFMSYMHVVTLLGCTVLVILYVGGLTQGIRYTGILLVIYIILVAVLGPPNNGSAVAASEYIAPVVGPISSPFGQRDGGFHYGIDFAVNEGTNVQASKSGTVSFAGYRDIAGNVVQIDHPDGSQTIYGHNNQLLASVGQPVKQGEIIALSGNTGRSTGPHVHFEIRLDKGKRSVDPAPYLDLK